jgi:VanZ family protein
LPLFYLFSGMIRYLWPAITWSIIVLVLTLIPGKELPDVPIFGIDKFVHVFIFGLLMVLTTYGLSKILLRNPALMSALYTCAFGIMVELIQPYVPGRSFSYFDILANMMGVVAGYICVLFLRGRYI